MSQEIIAELRRDHMASLLRRGQRLDGRGFEEFRPIRVETGVIRKAEGSARVFYGDTQVLVGVKMQPGTPFPDTPNQGVIISNAELVPLASPTFEKGPPSAESIEISRVVDRGIRESKCLDLEKLLIEEGKVWMVFIDIHALDHDGNLVDAAALGAISALLTAKVPNVRCKVSPADKPLEVRQKPVAVTVGEFEGKLLVDPGLEEQGLVDNWVTVISREDGSLAGMQKSGPGSLSPDQLPDIIDLGIRKGQELRQKFLP